MSKRLTKSATSSTLPSVTASVAARICTLSRRQFDRLVKDGVIPAASPLRYELTQAVPAYIRYLKSGKSATTAIADARLKHVTAQHRAIEQRTQERAGELVERIAVAQAFDGAMVTLASQLDGGPGRLHAAVQAAAHDSAKLLEVLQDEFRRIREAAATELRAFGSNLPRGAAPRAAAEARGRRVGTGEPEIA